MSCMENKNIQDLDDEQLLSFYESAKKLLETNLKNNNSSNDKKISNLKKKLLSLEEELKVRSLWEDE